MNVPMIVAANVQIAQYFSWRPTGRMTGGTQDAHGYTKALTSGTGAANINAAPDVGTLALVGTTPESRNILDILQSLVGVGATVLRTLVISNDSGAGSMTLSGSLATALGLSGQVLAPGDCIARTWAGFPLAVTTADVLTFTPSDDCTVTISYSGVVTV